MKRVWIVLPLLAACSSPPPAPPAPKEAPAAAPLPESKGDGLLRFAPPTGWVKEEPSNRMRKAQYRVPDKQKDHKDAEFTVFFFGASPVSVRSNIDRWVVQMGADKASPELVQGAACKVTLVDLSGTYSGDSQTGGPVEGARMLAAVVETEQGPWYFKVVGQAETVSDWREEFVAMLKAAKP